MSTDHYKRKLTAIVSADVVGYSRLMEADEATTIATLTACKSLMAELIARYRGRVVDAPGDNLLAAFASAVDAVNCAVEIQRRIEQEHSHVPEAQRMLFRVGINLDDVIEEQDHLYGDGVNIAARIQALAPVGGICVSGSIHDQVSHRLDFVFDYLGEQTVKNIDKPVRIYRLAESSHHQKKRSARRPKRYRVGQLAVLVLFLLIVAVVSSTLWDYPWIATKKESKSQLRPSLGAHCLSIAVLPFDDYSQNGDLGQFADALTDDIITNLSKIASLSVVARNSVFTYKNKPAKTQDVARDLNVQYVLEGSVRGVGDNILFNAQFIDARTGRHVWADRYDVELKNLFAMQVDITLKIVSALNLELTSQDKAALQAQGEDYLQAYLKRIEAGETTTAMTNSGNRAEIIFWESIKDSKDPAMFKEYLHQFPDGIFAGLAKLNSQKTAMPASAQSTPPKLPKSSPKPIPKEIIAAAPVTTKIEAASNARDSHDDHQEEVFWRSIDQSKNIAEYEEFLRKFPAGTFAGLAQIKITALKNAVSTKTSAIKKKKEISLAICTGRSELLGGNIGLYVTHDKIDFENGPQNELIFTTTLAKVFKQKPLYNPQYSFYCIGDEFQLKSDCKGNDLVLNTKKIWVKKGFQRKAPNVQSLCDLSKRLSVDAILVIRSYYIYPPSLVVDLFMIDAKSGRLYQESISTNSGFVANGQDVKNSVLTLLNRFETAF